MPEYSKSYGRYRILFLFLVVLAVWSTNSYAQLGNGSPYTIRTQQTGMCLDMSSGIGRQQPCNGSNAQLFSDANDGQVVVQSTQQCLDIEGISQLSGAQLQLWSCLNANNQKFDRIGDTIRPRHSGKCLDVEAASQSAGARIFQWSCHGGINQRFQIVDDDNNSNTPSVAGRWGNIINWPLVAVSMANLPDGRLLTYSGSERLTWPTTEQTYSAIWDPATGLFDESLYSGHNMFCGTMSMMEDGDVFVTGGRNQQNSPWTSKFDHQTNNWSPLQNMASGGRWYPTTLALGNGEIFTAMGASTNVANPDLWSPDTGWRVLNGINFLNMRQRRNELGRENMFPLLSVAPNGNIYHFWDTVENHFISTNGNGSSVPANPSTDSSSHAGGIQVMYDEGKLLISGTNDGSWGGNSSSLTSNAFTVDLNGAAPVIRATQNMNFVRKFHQLITLPTGEVLVVGGNTTGAKFQDLGSVFQTEIWNPQTGTWRLTAPISVPRDYHSTALLMTDGRVIVAGGGYHPSDPNSGGTHADAQVFTPPYLFGDDNEAATRPTVQADFTELGYGQNVGVSTSGNISYFSLIKMSATTHAINTDARFFKPDFTALGGGRYSITMHTNPNVATPGYWMLFAVDDNGVPSVAEVIRVTQDPEDPNNGQTPVIDDIQTSPLANGQSVTYTAQASGIGLNYSWNFGDGSGDTAASPLPSVSHTYSSPGRYIASVTVTAPGGQQAVETFTQIIHATLTANKPVSSSGLIELTGRGEIWNVNPDNNSVGVIGKSSLSRVAVIPVGQNPRSLAVAPDGRVWVVNKDDASISIVNTSSRTVQQTLQLDTGSRPHGIVFNDHSAYVALEGTGTLVQLNANNGSERRRVFAGDFPRHVSLRDNGDRLFVTAFITPALPGEDGANPDVAGQGGEVRVFSTSASALSSIRTIRLAHSNRSITEAQGPGLPNYLGPAVISPDGSWAWVPSKQDNILGGSLRSGTPLVFDQTVRAITSVINLGNETEDLSSRVDHDDASVASHAAFDPYGLTLFVSLEGNRQVAIIDAVTRLEIGRFDTGRAPQEVLMSESDNQLFVHNFMDRSITVYDVSEVVLNGSTDVTLLATINASSGERLSAEVLLGKQLFYDARDDRLAALDYMSCASCHNEGGHDGRSWDFTSLGEGVRNTINLKGTGGDAHGLLHWSANFDELQDFEQQIRQFAGGTGLMSDAQFFAGTRDEPLGDPKAGISPELDALAAYMRSLNTPLPSPYRAANGGLTADAANGQTLFQTKGCAGCHSGERFTDSSSSLLLHDIGTLTAASGSRLNGALNGIDTPTLLGAWHTAPYLHDGSATTIAQAISAHDGISVSSQELSQLASFVSELSPADVIDEPGCEAPTYDAATDKALIVWRDCDNIVHVVGAGGNDSASYTGTITSAENFTSITEHSMETGDSVIQSPQNRLAFDISLGGIYVDEFRYQVAGDAASCISITDRPADSIILAGSERTPVTSPFNPVTFQACAPPSDGGCGSPNVDPLVDNGVYVWKECTGDWNLMLTGDTDAGTVQAGGTISSELGLVSVTPQTLEGSDTLTTDDLANTAFDLRTSFPYEDRFTFESQLDDNVCVSLGALSPGYSVFAGPDRTPVSNSFNPETLESCTPPTDQCAPPVYDPGNERALFTWIDCAGQLHLVGTGAAANAQYIGHIYSDTDFINVEGNSLEPRDVLTTAAPNDVYFDMAMGGIWIDEVIITPTSDAVMCIDINAQSTGTQLFAGTDRTPVTSPFNPVTLASCTPPGGQCTAHSVDPAIDEGLFIWKDCSGNWTMTVTGESASGGSANYVGTVTSDTGFGGISPLSVESSDSVGTTTTQELAFNLTTSFPWEDSFEFTVDSAANLCVTITEMPSTLGRFAGSDRTPVSLSFDPVTLGSCL